jgi:hypothetical protein
VLYFNIYNSLVSGFLKQGKPSTAHINAAITLGGVTFLNLLAATAIASDNNIDWAVTIMAGLKDKRVFAAAGIVVVGAHLLLSQYYQRRIAHSEHPRQASTVLGNLYWFGSFAFILYASMSVG